jgi:hypothetical protein
VAVMGLQRVGSHLMGMVHMKVRPIEGQIEVKISIQNLDFQPELVHQTILEVVVVACQQIKFQTRQSEILTLSHGLIMQKIVIRILKNLNRRITYQFRLILST